MDLSNGQSARWARLCLVFVISFFGFAGEAMANPAANTTKVFSQPDGTQIEFRLWGDEYANGWESADGFTVRFDSGSGWWVYADLAPDGSLVESAARVGVDAPISRPHLRPSEDALRLNRSVFGQEAREPGLAAPAWASGSTNILHILVQFPADGPEAAVSTSFSPAEVQDNLFGGSSTGPGNMTDYYNEVSYNNLNLVGTVVGPYTLSEDKNEYDEGSLGAKDMVAEAIQLADGDVDFNDFDNDGDGVVDNVAVIYAGNGPDNGGYTGDDPDVNRLWPHASGLDAAEAVDGINAQTYYIAPELLSSSPRLRTIGVYAHEFGHKLGLPDLYDTDDTPDDSDGIGHWCLMASGSWASNNPGSENGESPSHMSAWCKYVMGWVTPVDQTGNSVSENIPQAETNSFAVRLGDNPNGTDDWGGGDGEYWLIENRQQTGFDIGIDGCGILVWHIDEAQTNNKSQGHTAGTHRLVDLEEADGLNDLDSSSSRGDSGDPFPGSTNNFVWDGSGSPNSDFYDGSNSGHRMAVLDAVCGADMNVTFGNQPPNAVCQNVELDADEDCLVDVAASEVNDGSTDPDGDPLTFSLSPAGPYGLGVTNVILTVTDDKGESDTCSATITVVDVTPPDIVCPGDIVVECSAPGGALVSDPQIVEWIAAYTVEDNCDANPVVLTDAPMLFPAGCPAGTSTLVTWTATDASGNIAQCSASLTVVDTTPPIFDLIEADRDALWPPNHKMVDIEMAIEVSDICDEDPAVTLIAAFSSQADNGNGDGNTTGDIEGADVGTDDRMVALRSERTGRDKDGRFYTLVYRVEDCSGNSAQDSVFVHVPHDKGSMAMAALGFSVDGTQPAAHGSRLEIVIPSVAGVLVEEGPKGQSANLGFDASTVLVDRVRLGNTAQVLPVDESRLQDMDGDGETDLILVFSRIEVVRLMESTALDGPLGIHYQDEARGEGYLIPDIFRLGTPIVAVADPQINVGPAKGEIATAPNPFNPQTELSFALERGQHIRFMIYDARGQLVRTLVNEALNSGVHSYVWDGRDGNGGAVASGFYFARLVQEDAVITKKLVMLK